MRDTTRRLLLRPRLLIAAMPLLLLTAPAVFAASACKGLDQATCTAREECRWMDGYTRKDGVQVSSHCRVSKPRSKDAAAAPEAVPAVTPARTAVQAPAAATKPTPTPASPAPKTPASTTSAPKAP